MERLTPLKPINEYWKIQKAVKIVPKLFNLSI